MSYFASYEEEYCFSEGTPPKFLKPWDELFNELLNRPSVVDEKTIDMIPQNTLTESVVEKQ